MEDSIQRDYQKKTQFEHRLNTFRTMGAGMEDDSIDGPVYIRIYLIGDIFTIGQPRSSQVSFSIRSLGLPPSLLS